MFSVKQKRRIAAVIEKALLELNHPEMPKERPFFELFVAGMEYWSFAKIRANWMVTDETAEATKNPHNEQVAAEMERGKPDAEQE